ncbi:MAG TPA: 2Fe-2S iron-sulfur cluster-binding protein [Caldimonas sp.]
MPQITYIHADGSRRTVSVAPGANVMRTAIENDIEGIVAECGGAAACATCHVYVEPEFARRFARPNEIEDEMLESTASGRRPESRLSCQLQMVPGLDELVVRIPAAQVL